jgi:hypothetical protein
MTPQLTRRTKRILVTHLRNERSMVTLDRREIHLASAKLLPTTSLRLAIINASSLSRSIAATTKLECGAFTKGDAGNCDKWKYGGAVHSRVAGQELVQICNHKFV